MEKANLNEIWLLIGKNGVIFGAFTTFNEIPIKNLPKNAYYSIKRIELNKLEVPNSMKGESK